MHYSLYCVDTTSCTILPLLPPLLLLLLLLLYYCYDNYICHYSQDPYIYHYTFGVEYNLDGSPVVGGKGAWSLDKRNYYGQAL